MALSGSLHGHPLPFEDTAEGRERYKRERRKTTLFRFLVVVLLVTQVLLLSEAVGTLTRLAEAFSA